MLTLTKSDLFQLKQGIIPQYFKDKNKDELLLILAEKCIEYADAVKEAHSYVWDVRTDLEDDYEVTSHRIKKLKMAEDTLYEVEAL